MALADSPINYALIDYTNTVINIVLWDGVTTWAPDSGIVAVPVNDPMIDATEYVEIGDTWNGTDFAVPVVEE